MIGDGMESIGNINPGFQPTKREDKKHTPIDSPPRYPNGVPREQYDSTCASLKIKVPNISDRSVYIDPTSFCCWLQGFAELSGQVPTEQQWELIKAHLALVFDKETPVHLTDVLTQLNSGKSNIVC